MLCKTFASFSSPTPFCALLRALLGGRLTPSRSLRIPPSRHPLLSPASPLIPNEPPVGRSFRPGRAKRTLAKFSLLPARRSVRNLRSQQAHR